MNACKEVDVAVIGNGPSAIILSMMLSGYWPYFSGKHPDGLLSCKLMEGADKSLVEQDLCYLAEGLEGRSSNPVALLFDFLNHPGADVGDKLPSSLEWLFDPSRARSHVVLGKQCPGGCWGEMEDSLLTLSHSHWLELPILSYQQWLKQCHEPARQSNSHHGSRTGAGSVGRYYSSYVGEMGLNFVSNATVTSLEHFDSKLEMTSSGRGDGDLKRKLDAAVMPQAKRLPEQNDSDEAVGSCPESPSSVVSNFSDSSDDSGCCSCPCMQYSAMSLSNSNCNDRHQYNWMLRGWCTTSSKCFKILAKTVVLACGTNDRQNVLGVPGENLSYVKNAICFKEMTKLSSLSKPVVVVGSGLSAADVILALLERRIPVAHVFRKKAVETANLFAKLSANTYPEYTHVFKLVTGKETDSCYRSYPQHVVKSFDDTKKCELERIDNGRIETLECSLAFVMTGGLADLSFVSPKIPLRGANSSDHSIHPVNNPLAVDPYSFAVDGVDNMYAIGSLVGDNFVRFVMGSALGVVNHLTKTS